MLNEKKVALLSKEIHAFLKQEQDEKGPEGLYQWYRYKFVPYGIGLAPYDIGIARFVLANRDLFDRHVEIGAAAAQGSLLLAVHRMPSYAVEANPTNVDLLARLIEHLRSRMDPDLSKYITQVHNWYPNQLSEYTTSRSLLCFPTLSWGMTQEQEQAAIDALRAAAGVIFGLRDFFRWRQTEAEQAELINRIRAEGFDAPIEVYEWKRLEYDFPPNRIMYMARSGGPATKAVRVSEG